MPRGQMNRKRAVFVEYAVLNSYSTSQTVTCRDCSERSVTDEMESFTVRVLIITKSTQWRSSVRQIHSDSCYAEVGTVNAGGSAKAGLLLDHIPRRSTMKPTAKRAVIWGTPWCLLRADSRVLCCASSQWQSLPNYSVWWDTNGAH